MRDGRELRIEVRLSAAEKELVSAAAKAVGITASEFIRENEVSTSLSVLMAELNTGAEVEVSEEVVRQLFTDDMKRLNKKSPEQRKKEHEIWLNNVKKRSWNNS